MEKSKQNTVIFDNGSLNTRIGFSSKDKPQFSFQTSAQRNNETVFPVKTGIIVDFDAMESVWTKSFSKDGLNVDPKEHGVVMTESVLAPKMQRETLCQIMFEKFNVPYFYVAPSPLFSLYSVGKKSGVVVDIGDSTTTVAPLAEGSLINHAVEKIEFGGRDISYFLQQTLNKTYAVNGQQGISLEEAYKIKENFLYVSKDYQNSLASIERLSKKKQPQQQATSSSANSADNSAQSEEQKKASAKSQKGVNGLYMPQEYTLPDGKIITIEPKLRFEILEYSLFSPPTQSQPSFFEKYLYPPETYFKEKRMQALNSQKKGSYFSNDNNPKEHDGLHKLVYASVMKSSAEFRKQLLGNVILAGGSSMFDGLQHRLATELELISNSSYQPTRVYLAANGGAVTAGDSSRAFGMVQNEDYAWGTPEGSERVYSSWAGAAIFTQLSSFQNICIRKAEYNEHGPAFVHRKTM